MSLLDINDLGVRYSTDTGEVRAVDDVSFRIQEGETFGLVGESGCGKTTAARALIGLLDDNGEVTGGSVRKDGRDLTAVSDEELRATRWNEIATIPQNVMNSLNPVETVGSQILDVIQLHTDRSREEARDHAEDLFEQVGLTPDRMADYPHEFSGGMLQRAVIAMAMSCDPDLIIADEPTTALDVTVEGQILEMVRDLQEKYDTSFIWVTHDMSVVAEICDRVNVMYLGEIIEHAEVDDLFYETKHPYTQALLDSMPRPDRTVHELDPIKGVMPEAIDPPSGCRFHSRCPDAREVCREVHPEPRDLSDEGEETHSAACVKYDAFEVGYEESRPIETEATGGFSAGLTETEDGE